MVCSYRTVQINKDKSSNQKYRVADPQSSPEKNQLQNIFAKVKEAKDTDEDGW